MKFGERVKTLRIQRGLSQDELARKIGYKDRSSIAKIENGTRDVPRPVIIKLANALSVDASTLMRDDELARIVRRQSEVINEVTLPQETTEMPITTIGFRQVTCLSLSVLKLFLKRIDDSQKTLQNIPTTMKFSWKCVALHTISLYSYWRLSISLTLKVVN